MTCAQPSTRSARPSWPPPVISSTTNQASSAAMTQAAPAGDGRPQAPGSRRPRPPGRQRPGGEEREAGPGPERVREREAARACLGIGRDQDAREATRRQDEASGRGGGPQGQPGGDVARRHQDERSRHDPRVSRAAACQRADALPDRIEGRGLQRVSGRPPADQQNGSRSRREHAPPRYGSHQSTVGERRQAGFGQTPQRGPGAQRGRCTPGPGVTTGGRPPGRGPRSSRRR